MCTCIKYLHCRLTILFVNYTIRKSNKKIVSETLASSEVLLGKDMLPVVGRTQFLAGCGFGATLSSLRHL